MRHRKCNIFLKVLAWGMYLGLGIFAMFFASGVWDKYHAYASNFMLVEEMMAESPTITFELGPNCNINVSYGIDSPPNMVNQLMQITEGHNLYENTTINYKKMNNLMSFGSIHMITTDFIPNPKRALIHVQINEPSKCKLQYGGVLFVITSEQNAYGMIHDYKYKEGRVLHIPTQLGVVTFTRIEQEKRIFLSKEESPKSKCSNKR